MSFFVYRSLTPDKQRIRLIHLLPINTFSTEGDDRIHCTVSHVPLYDAPAFTALSYNWGTLDLVRTISLNDRPFNVTVNVEVALRHLRLPDCTRTLWIDSLCIDQNDEIEKSEQVSQMGQIYARAEQVISWLGPAADDSDLAIDWIARFGIRSSSLGIGTTTQLRLRHLLSDFERARSLPNNDIKDFLEELYGELHLNDPTTTSRLCKSLSKIFQRPYWNRVWVVQEVARARNLTFMCGRALTTEDAVHYASRLLRNFRQHITTRAATPEPLATSTLFSIVNIDTQDPIDLLKSRRVREQLPMIHLLHRHSKFHATDPRDKVFALLGLSEDAQKLGIVANYSSNWREVYTSVARKLLTNGFTEILSLCTLSSTSAYGLSSWVPNWSHRGSSGPLQQRGLNRTSQPYTSLLLPAFSAGHSERDVELNFDVDDDGQSSIRIAGKLIGEVLDVGDPWVTGGVCRWLQDLDKLSRQIYTSKEESLHRLNALCRASVADQEIRQGSQKPRLSDANINNIQLCLRTTDKEPIRSETLTRHGLGAYCQQIQDIGAYRRPISVNGKYLGIGPSDTEIGDFIYVLHGCHVPFTLRPNSANSYFKLVGETYVHGIMDNSWDVLDTVVETITIM